MKRSSYKIRWPTTVTAKSFYLRQNQFRHGKIIFATAKSFPLTAKSFYSRQNQFRHGKINFTHGKIIFTHGKINFATAKSFSLTAKSFWLTFSRDISSQSAMGANPTWRSSSWFLSSTCVAQTVEIVCLQQHVSACSVDKVSRNWFMDVFKHTQYIRRTGKVQNGDNLVLRNGLIM